MRIRSALAPAFLAALLSACANVTGPMECDGNPKCKADLQPTVPTELKLAPVAAAAPKASHPSLASRSTQIQIGFDR